MACANCKTIRDLLLHGKMAAAAGLTVETLREKIGFTPEPVENTTEGLRTTMVIDAASDHRAPLSGKNKAELLEIAAAEGAVVEDGATNAQIVEAIEAQRVA